MRLRTPSPPPDLALATPPEPSASTDLGRVRRRTIWRTRLRRGGIAAAVLAVLGLATWVIGYSDLLAVKQAKVEGVEPAVESQVRQAADVPMGQPLARVDTEAIATRVETVPEVDHAIVRRAWPSTVVVTVTPREPVASLMAGGRWRLVDDEGVLFSTVDRPAAGLPRLSASASDDAVPAREAGVSVAAALSPEVLAKVDRIESSSPSQVRLVLRDGRQVMWGSADQPEAKAAVLAALLKTPGTDYDVSVPGRPSFRPVVERDDD